METCMADAEVCIEQINAMNKTDFHQRILRGVAASEEFSCLYYWCYYARIGLLVCQRCNLAQEKPRTEFYGDTP